MTTATGCLPTYSQ